MPTDKDSSADKSDSRKSDNRLMLHTAFRSVLGPFLLLVAAAALFLVAMSLSGNIIGIRAE